MSAPLVVSTNPAPDATDVLLGALIEVLFDQALDTDTLDASTFVVSTPGTHTEYTPEFLLTSSAKEVAGREYVDGTFVFASVSGCTKVTFTPDKAFQPNQTYTVILAGSGSIAGNVIQNGASESLATSYQFSFSTGGLNLVTAPPRSIPIEEIPQLLPGDIEVSPVVLVGNDLAGAISLTFPADIDPSSVDLDKIGVLVEAILNDQDVVVPSPLSYTAAVSGNKLTITISGWPPVS